jgi:hypothetical protein
VKKSKYIRLGIIIFIIIVVAFVALRWGVIFQRGNPLPYVSQMITLNESNPYAQVFDDEDIYITKGNTDAFIKFIEEKYEVSFIEQMGSFIFFGSDERTVNAETEVYWSRYLVWEFEITDSIN